MKKYVAPTTKVYTFESESDIICASPSPDQQKLLDKHHKWYWDGEHVRNGGGQIKGAPEYRNNLWEE